MTKRRILVVDDEPDIRRLVAEALTSAGYEVEVAADGDEAVRRGGLFIPDLVLLDIMMPASGRVHRVRAACARGPAR